MAATTYADVSWKRMSNAVERDLMDVGLVDRTWLPKVPATLRPRLQELLDHPEG